MPTMVAVPKIAMGTRARCCGRRTGAFSNRPATIAIAHLTDGRRPRRHGVRVLRALLAADAQAPAETWVAVRDESAAPVPAVASSGGEAVDLGELIFNLTKNVNFHADRLDHNGC